SGPRPAACVRAFWLVLWPLRRAVKAAALLPAALVYLPSPGWVSIAGWYAALAFLPFLGARRWPRIATAGLLSLVLALSLWQWVRPGDGKLRVTFLDVGQGDAILVEAPEGPRLLVDGGPGGARRLDVEIGRAS